MLAGLAALAACHAEAPDGDGSRSPCAALTLTATGATAAQQDGIAGAIALWRGRGVSAFDPAGTAAERPDALEIRFDAAAATFHGIYDQAADRVLINRDLTEPAMLGVVIAHELGHVFGLVHISPQARASLMNPGNLSTPPTDDDQRALEALWGACR